MLDYGRLGFVTLEYTDVAYNTKTLSTQVSFHGMSSKRHKVSWCETIHAFRNSVSFI
jgi:hypothetical protein